MIEDRRSLPALSIVIVNSDSAGETLNCLESIYENPPGDSFEVIVVDNCSQVSCLPLVEVRYPQVRTFSALQRQGFAKNYNLGIRQSCGEFILILNNDTLVNSGALDNLISAMRNHPEYGMAGPKLLDSKGKIQTVCARELITPSSYILTQFVLDLGSPTGKLWDHYRRRQLKDQDSGPVACICGACMLVKREILDEIGLLDEGYDFYYEDVEWCHRVQKYGYQVAYVPEAEVTHLGDRSLSKIKEWAKRSEYQSAMRYFRQYHNLTKVKLRLVWLATVVSYFLRACVFWGMERISRKSLHARAYINLTQWIAQQAPG